MGDMVAEAVAVFVPIALAWVMWAWWWAEIQISGTNRDWTLSLAVGFLRWQPRLVWTLPQTGPTGLSGPTLDAKVINRALIALRVYRRWASIIARYMHIDWFELELDLGLGSPHYTGLVVGWVNIAVSWWLQAIIQPMSASPPRWQIRQDFDRLTISARVSTRFKMRGWMVVYAAAAATWLGLTIVAKRTARRRDLWQRIRQTFTPATSTRANIRLRD